MSPAAESRIPLLQVQDLAIEATGDAGPVRLVDGVSFEVHQDEVFALVGESGSGKSLTVLAIMDLLPPGVRVSAGRILFRGRDLTKLPERDLRRIRGKDLAMVFQDPMSALNPLQRVGRQLAEAVKLHATGLNRKQTAEKVHSLLAAVGVPDPAGRAAMILITHDLGLVAEAADRVAVMYSGKVVETAGVRDLFHRPAHPYTVGLLASVLGEGTAGGRAFTIPGSPPAAADRPAGCAFAPRCHASLDQGTCTTTAPLLELLPTPPAGAHGPGHPAGPRAAACHFAGNNAGQLLLKGQQA
ncbi:ABC transporter ATP-binding protein [Pseudarthrobacter sp. MEB009]|uniref:ABC transporter ATP-binding protein n=1 Tax=Pseudarthrobacter sp. MEB009 TaxID=3040326 RepID=UPI00255551B2|nr:ABC transporter ATP-binding protein [Pseudarthrobacter sp. MEB009]